MKKIQYSPTSLEKLKLIKKEIAAEYGVKTAASVIKNMQDSVKGLKQFEKKDPSVERLTGIPCDYRYLYVMKIMFFTELMGILFGSLMFIMKKRIFYGSCLE